MKQYKANRINVKRNSRNNTNRRQSRGGAVPADPALNSNYCDLHVTQCKDSYSTCQQGGLNKSHNNRVNSNSNRNSNNNRKNKNNHRNNSRTSKNNNRRQSLGGAVPADPALNSNYCDLHVTQCKDSYSTCQQGGTLINPSINPSYCDAHSTQCTDHYSGCGGANLISTDNDQSYKEYKKYKKLYKQLKSGL